MLSMFRYSPFPFLSLWGVVVVVVRALFAANPKSPDANRNGLSHCIRSFVGLVSFYWALVGQSVFGALHWMVWTSFNELLGSFYDSTFRCCLREGEVYMNCVHDLRKGRGLSHPFSQAARASSWMIIGGYGVFQSLDKSRLGCMHGVQEETREKQGPKKISNAWQKEWALVILGSLLTSLGSLVVFYLFQLFGFLGKPWWIGARGYRKGENSGRNVTGSGVDERIQNMKWGALRQQHQKSDQLIG